MGTSGRWPLPTCPAEARSGSCCSPRPCERATRAGCRGCPARRARVTYACARCTGTPESRLRTYHRSGSRPAPPRLAADVGGCGEDAIYERAEVSPAVPQALVLAPEDMADAAGWPEFSPATLTAEARRRGEMYAERRRREQEGRAFAGSRDEFLRYCGTKVTIAPAAGADAPRLHELSVRTHQFNTTGEVVAAAALRTLIASPAHQVTTVRLSDRFGDDGMVGGCVVEPGADRGWTVTLLMMSCRAMGRGVIEALLAWLARPAPAAAARCGG